MRNQFCSFDVNMASFRGAFLGAFAKLRKATVSFVMSVSVRMERVGLNWTDFYEIWYLKIFRKYVGKLKFN